MTLRWRNSSTRFGMATRLLHWLMALGILSTLPLGLYIARMQVSFDNLWLFGLHKSIGLTLLGLVFLRLAWHRWTRPPRPKETGIPRWQIMTARLVHAGLYALMLFTPLAGWVAASATGIDTILWSHWIAPPLVGPDKAVADIGFVVHTVLAWSLGALVLLHITGALKRTLHQRDGTLRRMVTGGE